MTAPVTGSSHDHSSVIFKKETGTWGKLTDEKLLPSDAEKGACRINKNRLHFRERHNDKAMEFKAMGQRRYWDN